jgi:hypothetical protein
MHDRSQRRTDKHKAIQRAARAYPTLSLEHHRQLADNRKPCSCWMCGNPRRYMKGDERQTMQERRAVLDQHDTETP